MLYLTKWHPPKRQSSLNAAFDNIPGLAVSSRSLPSNVSRKQYSLLRLLTAHSTEDDHSCLFLKLLIILEQRVYLFQELPAPYEMLDIHGWNLEVSSLLGLFYLTLGWHCHDEVGKVQG